MTRKTIFICDKCGKQYDIPVEARKCEAGHLGLTLEEFSEYHKLLNNERCCGINISIAKNERTEKALDDAVNAVIQFKNEHNISDDN